MIYHDNHTDYSHVKIDTKVEKLMEKRLITIGTDTDFVRLLLRPDQLSDLQIELGHGLKDLHYQEHPEEVKDGNL